MERKLTAILSADVAGYSRLMGEDEAATVRTLTAYREVMTSLIRQHRGRVVDTPGDNLLAEFASVVDAVACAAEIQEALKTRNAELPDHRRMQFRIGINLGDVIVDGERIYGDGVNIAARVEGLAEAGGVCVSGTVYDQVENKLALGYASLGEHTVKNIAKPVRVYRVRTDPGAPAAPRGIGVKRLGGRRWQRAALAGGGLLLLLGVGGAAIWKLFPPSRPRLELPDKPSIAVLPFTNMSEDPKQEYFADGMTEDLTTELSKLPGLFVIARNSTFTYKGKPVKVQQVSLDLGVHYVLEGSVRKVGERVRINAQLIDATTGRHLWAARYDGEIGDVFALQDEVTRKIVAALAVTLPAGEPSGATRRKETANVAAYDAFLQGRAHYVRRTPEDYAKAASQFEKAIELDPGYGRAYAALAATYWESWQRGWEWTRALGVSHSGARDRAEEYLRNAMNNPTPLAHRLASEMRWRGRQYEEAIAEAQRAITLDPNDADSHVAMAMALIWAGRAGEAVDFVKKAMRLDPHYPPYYSHVLGLAYFGMDQFQQAATLFERALERNPEDYPPLIPLAAAYGHLGQPDKARAALDTYRTEWEWQGAPPVTLHRAWWPYKERADADRLAEGLRQAGLR
ncbi:MAG: adenylate/guanylate cyclase domain-containing protein [Candidatus Rokubacteria bacterium]|nr:adenylate/guanylate cyclase domain-containing protein [Candidatus Rokubacteria bacterium]